MQSQEIVVNDIYFSDMKNTLMCDELVFEWELRIESMGNILFPRHHFLMFLILASASHKVFTSSVNTLCDISQGISHTLVSQYPVSFC